MIRCENCRHLKKEETRVMVGVRDKIWKEGWIFLCTYMPKWVKVDYNHWCAHGEERDD